MTVWQHTAIHEPRCVCSSCHTSEFSAPADALDDEEFAEVLRAAPGTRFVSSGAEGTDHRFPRARIAVSGVWGGGEDRVATVSWPQSREKLQRSVSIGDNRSIIDAHYDTPPGRPGRRTVVAGRYRFVERACADGNDISVALAELLRLAEGLVDVAVVVEAETCSDYGYGGELVDVASGRLFVTGWERIP